MSGRRANPGILRRVGALGLLTLAVLTLVGCNLFSDYGKMRPTPAPPTLDLVNIDPAQRAAVLALSANPLFTSDANGDGGITPYDESLIGQANWYKVAPGLGEGIYVVTVRLGWGDCQAGCIDEHFWDYTISGDKVSGVTESGVTMPPFDFGPGGPSSLAVRASAGPTCPVERIPPDPACADRPVVNALITATPLTGQSLSARTDANGAATLQVPAGVYLVTAESDTVGLPGNGTESVVMAIAADGSASANFGFDTGIR